jgi:hypothetical protein
MGCGLHANPTSLSYSLYALSPLLLLSATVWEGFITWRMMVEEPLNSTITVTLCLWCQSTSNAIFTAWTGRCKYIILQRRLLYHIVGTELRLSPEGKVDSMVEDVVVLKAASWSDLIWSEGWLLAWLISVVGCMHGWMHVRLCCGLGWRLGTRLGTGLSWGLTGWLRWRAVFQTVHWVDLLGRDRDEDGLRRRLVWWFGLCYVVGYVACAEGLHSRWRTGTGLHGRLTWRHTIVWYWADQWVAKTVGC